MRKLTLVRGGTTHRTIMLVTALVVAGVLLYLPLYYPPYQVFLFTEVLAYSIAVLSLNLLTGYTGQISLGHSFFFAIGAYATAIMFRDLDVHFVIPILVAFAISFVVGFLVGIPALRLTGIYLALVTIALAVITPPVITRFGGLTGGSQGINIDKPEAPAWTGLANDQWLYYVCLVVAAIMFLVGRNLVKGGIGRSLTAVRDNELAARTMGVNPAVPKTMAFAYSAGFAGVAGALYTLVVGLVAPTSFTIILAINLLVGTVVGGMATIAGAVFGAAFITYVPIYTSDLNPALGGVLYGVALILFMFVMPGGVMGLAHRVRVRFVALEEPDEAKPTRTEPTGPAGSAPTEDGDEVVAATRPADRRAQEPTTGDRRENGP
jgi:branched-chain amino acid transport system permease protein